MWCILGPPTSSRIQSPHFELLNLIYKDPTLTFFAIQGNMPGFPGWGCGYLLGAAFQPATGSRSLFLLYLSPNLSANHVDSAFKIYQELTNFHHLRGHQPSCLMPHSLVYQLIPLASPPCICYTTARAFILKPQSDHVTLLALVFSLCFIFSL